MANARAAKEPVPGDRDEGQDRGEIGGGDRGGPQLLPVANRFFL